jgi:Uma2 family endonuclease
MQSPRHRLAARLLSEPLERYLADRGDLVVGSQMAIWYGLDQLARRAVFAPDLFVAVGTPDPTRRSWATWDEDGHTPIAAIELTSRAPPVWLATCESLRVWEHFRFDLLDEHVEVHVQGAQGAYVRRLARSDGDFDCATLGLRLGVVRGTHGGITAGWLRWKLPDGTVLPTNAEAEKARADRLAAKLRAAGIDPDA